MADDKDKPPMIQEKTIDRSGNPITVEYAKGPLLGKGSSGEVYQLTSMATKIKYAGKIIDKSKLKSRAKENLMNEIKIHQALRNKGIVRLWHFFHTETHLYILTDLMPNGTIHDMMLARNTLSELEIQYFAKQILQILNFLRSKRIIHRDLKLENFLLDNQMQVQLCDFGLAAQLNSYDEHRTSFCGPPHYMAPEMASQARSGHSFEIDVWAFGVCLYQMLCGQLPFKGSTVTDLTKKIQEGKWDFPKGSYSRQVKDLISKMLVANPTKRIVLEDIGTHEFFSKNKLPTALPSSLLKTEPDDKFFQLYIPNYMAKGEGQKQNNQAKELILPQLAVEGQTGYQEAINSARSSRMRERKLTQGAGQVGLQNRILNSTNSKSSKNLGLNMLNLPLIKKNSIASAENNNNAKGQEINSARYSNRLSSARKKTTEKRDDSPEEPDQQQQLPLLSSRGGNGAISARSGAASARRQPVKKKTQQPVQGLALTLIKKSSQLNLPSARSQRKLSRQHSTVVISHTELGAGSPQSSAQQKRATISRPDDSPKSGKRSLRSSARGSHRNSTRNAVREEDFVRQDSVSPISNVSRKKTIHDIPSAELEPPRVFVQKWVDYSEKYGIGYCLSDGSTGVHFNDSSKISRYGQNDEFCYVERDRSSQKKSDKVENLQFLSEHPPHLQKKLDILKHFTKYLSKQDGSSAKVSKLLAPSDAVPDGSGLVYVKKWQKTSHGTVFCLSNKLVQIYFKDRTELFCNLSQKTVTYISKQRQITTLANRDAAKSQNEDFVKRLKYVRDLLKKSASIPAQHEQPTPKNSKVPLLQLKTTNAFSTGSLVPQTPLLNLQKTQVELRRGGTKIGIDVEQF